MKNKILVGQVGKHKGEGHQTHYIDEGYAEQAHGNEPQLIFPVAAEKRNGENKNIHGRNGQAMLLYIHRARQLIKVYGYSIAPHCFAHKMKHCLPKHWRRIHLNECTSDSQSIAEFALRVFDKIIEEFPAAIDHSHLHQKQIGLMAECIFKRGELVHCS
jgi:hypothetical protein